MRFALRPAIVLQCGLLSACFLLSFVSAAFPQPTPPREKGESQAGLPLGQAQGLAAAGPAQGLAGGQAQGLAPTLAKAIEEALKLLDERKPDAAMEAFLQVQARAVAEGDVYMENRAKLGLGYVHFQKGEYAKAQTYSEEALAYFTSIGEHERIGRAQAILGTIAHYMGEMAKSRDMWEQAAASFQAAGNLRSRAAALKDLGHHREVIEIARQIGDKNLEASALHSWADRLFTAGNFAEAWPKLEQAAALYGETKNRSNLATVYVSMGHLQRAHGYPEQAIPFYQDAIRIQEELGEKTTLMQSLNAMGVAYGYLGQLAEARRCFERGLRIAEETGSPRLVDFMRGALAANALHAGDYHRALGLIEAIIQRGADPNLSVRYDQLASALLGLNRNEEALVAAEKAVALAGQRDRLPGLLWQLAEAHRRVGKTSDARASLQRALEVLEEQRAKLIPTDFMRRGFSEQYQNIYAQTIALQYEQGDHAQALETAERARSRAFLDLLATRELELRQADTAALKELQVAGKEAGSGAAAASQTNDAVLTMRGAATAPSALTPKRPNSDPGLPSLVSAASLSFAQMQEAAARLRSTILSYWVAEKEFYIWVVPPRGAVHSTRVDVRSVRLAELAGAATGMGASPPGSLERALTLASRGGGKIAAGPGQKEALRELYKLLIAPVSKQLPGATGSRLTVIAHGPLTRLSFAALLDEKGGYLIEKFALHYAPSTALLNLTQQQKRSGRESAGYLLVADPALPPPASKLERPLPPLPGTREEVQAIARSAAASRSTLLLGAEAAEGRVRLGMKGKRVVHFATHGVMNDQQPFDSFIALARQSDAEDGRLTAQEIYGVELSADLVVLSTCRSGGAVLNGDGIAAMARAFFYAGTPSLIVTLWDVADEPSKRLLPEFYRAWRRGDDKSAALRTAQLRLLRDLRNGKVTVNTAAGTFALSEDPTFWAGYVLVGEP